MGEVIEGGVATVRVVPNFDEFEDGETRLDLVLESGPLSEGGGDLDFGRQAARAVAGRCRASASLSLGSAPRSTSARNDCERDRHDLGIVGVHEEASLVRPAPPVVRDPMGT